jgi:hypothetical protein
MNEIKITNVLYNFIILLVPNNWRHDYQHKDNLTDDNQYNGRNGYN